MYDDEFTLEEYGLNVKQLSSKNFLFVHGKHKYGKDLFYNKVEIVYREGEVDTLISTTMGNNGKKKRFKSLYLEFIENIGNCSETTLHNFLTIKTPLKRAVFSKEEYEALSEKNKNAIRGSKGKIIIDNIDYYAANNLNISEYINCIYERVPKKEHKNVVFKLFGVYEDNGANLIDLGETSENVDLSNINAAAFTVDVITEEINHKTSKTKVTKKKISIDYEKTNKTKISSGKFGEELVLLYEKKKLIEAGLNRLAKKVKNVSENTSLGYDIISYDANGHEIHIEVKSTKNNKQDGFYISANELIVANDSDFTDNYFIYRVYGINTKKCNAKLHIFKAPFEEDKYELNPVSYYVKLKST